MAKNKGVDMKENLQSRIKKKKVWVKRSKQKTANVKGIHIKPEIKLPKLAEDFSSNWKQLQQVLGLSKKRKYGPKKVKVHPELKLNEKSTAESGNNNSEVWFDLEDVHLVASTSSTSQLQLLETEKPSLTTAVAMDCEMVGVGYAGKDSVLARVSIVNEHGHCLYDTHVKTIEKVTDYRTHVSGVTPVKMKEAKDFRVVQKEVNDILKDRILIGHAIKNDLKVLFLDHPRRRIRDTSKYKPFRKLIGGGTPSLKKLALQILGMKIQEGEHDSIQDAQVAMQLYQLHTKEWERSLKMKKKT